MKLFLHVLHALAVVSYASAANHDLTAEVAADQWLASHGRAPGADELADLKGANPEAYAIVKALLTKQAMGLIKRTHSAAADAPVEPVEAEQAEQPALAPAAADAASPSAADAASPSPSGVSSLPPGAAEVAREPLAPEMLAAPHPDVVADGAPTELAGTGAEAPRRLPELLPQPPTAPPAMPPPPPVSPELPPELPDLYAAAPGPAPEALMASAPGPSVSVVASPRLSAAATSTAVRSGGGHDFMNWNSDKMIADNERMVQNVLGAVAELTGKHAPRPPVHYKGDSVPVAEEASPEDSALHEAAEAPAQPAPVEAAPMEAISAPPPVRQSQADEVMAAAETPSSEPAKVQSAADQYLASSEPSKMKSDAVIADNERMVQNVLGAVARLTGRRPPRPPVHYKGNTIPVADDDASSTASAEAASQPTPVVEAVSASMAGHSKTEEVKEMPEKRAELAVKVHSGAAAEQSADDGIAGHLPGSVSWNSPYTFSASGNAQGASSTPDNSYLKDIDFGVPQVRPMQKTPDDENPYLQGLDLMPTPAPQASASPSPLGSMHQSQLLSSHKLLSSFDWGDKASSQARIPKATKAAKAPRDPLSGFLGPRKSKSASKGRPAALTSKNAYLAKLGNSKSSASYSSSSVLASNIEKDNPYLQSLDEPVAQQPLMSNPAPVAQPSTASRKQADTRDVLANFKWDDSQPQTKPLQQVTRHLAMASSKVQQKAQVVSRASSKVVKKDKHALTGWLGGKTQAKVPDLKAQRLKQAVAQRIADAKNPYLKGLDLEPPKPTSLDEQDNQYMTSLA